MSDQKYSFQYCQKIVLFSEDWQSVLLARRHREADYDGTFSFIGGKMETTDATILESLRREKNEEIGEQARVKIYLDATYNVLFRKQDGNAMILPHYVAHYQGGTIKLHPQEYSAYRWVPLNKLDSFEPKIENIPSCAAWAHTMRKIATPETFVTL